MKLKVCGLKQPENINEVAGLQPDYMGFICYAPSPRYIAGLTLGMLAGLPADIIKTAVFVNETEDIIGSLINAFGFDALQLHGNESPEFCSIFKGSVQVIKAFGVDDGFDFGRLDAYVGHVDLFLFDTKTPGHGGSGKTFNWQLLNNYKLDVPFFLSGGIGPENLEEIKDIEHPQFYGVDLNSRFETAPGMKDIEKLTAAAALVKQFDTNELRS